MEDTNIDTMRLLNCLSHILGHNRPNVISPHEDKLPSSEPGITVAVPKEKLCLQGLKCHTARLWQKGKTTEILKRLDCKLERERYEGHNLLVSMFSTYPSSALSKTGCTLSSTQSCKKSITSQLTDPAWGTHAFEDTEKTPNSFYAPRRIPSIRSSPPVSVRIQNTGVSFCPVSINNHGNGQHNNDSSVGNKSLFSTAETKSVAKNVNTFAFKAVVKEGISFSFENEIKPSEKHEFKEKLPSDDTDVKPFQFKTAYEQLAINDRAKGIKRSMPQASSVHVSGLRKVPRVDTVSKPESNSSSEVTVSDNPEVNELMQNDCMKNIDPKMVEAILNEVVEVATTAWEDIAGLDGVKSIIKEIIIWPMLRPDIFTGLRGPPKGILLFGPPGTGKTMIGRLISTQSKSTFFNISASSLTSKWIGDGEKMVRALFQVARVKQPAVIFIDEIDSILTQRSDTEHESSRRLKTEFLIQFDGCGTKSEDRILVIGVTNRPQELDEAARRRLVKRIYIPLPDHEGRKQLVKNLLFDQIFELSEEDFDVIAKITKGYSGADMRSLCQEAAYGPIRDVGHLVIDIDVAKVRPMLLRDFQNALKHVKASVAETDLSVYQQWDLKFGCHI